ncbi:hypothetical protein B0H13DRAFT_1907288 [Mycena leptocephala]|nr:hypothetical protein B0H13DRAFT_1907288 [Mycena leptocephala]
MSLSDLSSNADSCLRALAALSIFFAGFGNSAWCYAWSFTGRSARRCIHLHVLRGFLVFRFWVLFNSARSKGDHSCCTSLDGHARDMREGRGGGVGDFPMPSRNLPAAPERVQELHERRKDSASPAGPLHCMPTPAVKILDESAALYPQYCRRRALHDSYEDRSIMGPYDEHERDAHTPPVATRCIRAWLPTTTLLAPKDGGDAALASCTGGVARCHVWVVSSSSSRTITARSVILKRLLIAHLNGLLVLDACNYLIAGKLAPQQTGVANCLVGYRTRIWLQAISSDLGFVLHAERTSGEN